MTYSNICIAEPEHLPEIRELTLRCHEGKPLGSAERVDHELSINAGPLYRTVFYVKHCDKIVASAVVNACGWASRTHVLQLLSVHPEHRGHGLALELYRHRIHYVKSHFGRGRIVCSAHAFKHLMDLGFTTVPSHAEGVPALAYLEF